MGLNLASASTMYLTNSTPPITAYPFAFGAWASIASADATARTICALSDTATTTNYIRLGKNTSDQPSMEVNDGTATISSISLAFTANTWFYIFGRFFNATTRSLACWYPVGNVGTTSSAVSRSPTGLDTLTIGALQTSAGASQPWGGGIAEWWMTSEDFWYDTATAVDAGFIRTLALNGPLAFEFFKHRLIEYRTFRSSLDTISDPSEIWRGVYASQSWTPTNTPGIGEHPALATTWVSPPLQTKRLLTI